MSIIRGNFIIGILLLIAMQVSGQQAQIDSLKNELALTKDDTVRLVISGRLASIYREINPDSTIQYSEAMLAIARKLEVPLEEAIALGEIGYALTNISNYPRSLQVLLSAVSIAEDPAIEGKLLPPAVPAFDEFTDRHAPKRLQRLCILAKLQQYLGILYGNSGNFKKAMHYYATGIPLARESGNLQILCITYGTMARAYSALNNPDSALLCLQTAYDIAMKADYKRYVGSMLLNTGRVYLVKRDPLTAKAYFKRALAASKESGYLRGVVASSLELADMYRTSGKGDSSQYHIREALAVANYMNAPDLLQRCYAALVELYKKTNTDSTVKYQSMIIQINRETFNIKQVQQFQNIDFDEQQRLNEREATKKEYQARLRTNFFLGSTLILVTIAFFLYRNSRTKQKAKQNIEKAYDQLKATQAQLVQSEKMASLGELTAGIAHEIQNPLNFVNNFSEVNSELIIELKEAAMNGRLEEVKSIATTLEENESKIVAHGKRADGIVKSMLQHSRKGSGQKEVTDINALCDEYLRLAYHGLRAKDKSFNATFTTEFEPTIGTINVIPQEIGRVILNLINNAFYAVTERGKLGETGYTPTVKVSTSKESGKVIIKVKDNGKGIPDQIKDKIFQPFFTTKPTGQGTGLGLSLSYDIVTKGHGGDLKVETKEGEGSTFTIQLPNFR